MEKVKLNRELADSLTDARKRCTDDEILHALAQSSFTCSSNDKRGRAILNVLKARGNTPLLQIASALIYGYEIEKTPEEKVHDYYASIREQASIYSEPHDIGTAEGIKFTLDTLGIKIEGVNA